MTEAGKVEVPLSRYHCRATAWWLSRRLVPYAVQQWRTTRSLMDARTMVTASRLARQFDRFAKRHLKGVDQDRDAKRALTREDAAWLAAFLVRGHSTRTIGEGEQWDDFPVVVPWTGEWPTNEQFAAMPMLAAQTILFGLGTDETMRRCHERVYSRKTGPKRKSLTLADLENRQVGNALDGGDERYERRLRKRANEDEIAAELAEEWDRVMRALEARGAGDSEISDNSYPPAIESAR